MDTELGQSLCSSSLPESIKRNSFVILSKTGFSQDSRLSDDQPRPTLPKMATRPVFFFGGGGGGSFLCRNADACTC